MENFRAAVNGLGRMGRRITTLSETGTRPVSIEAFNDLGDPQVLAMLLQYDSTHGKFPRHAKYVKRGDRDFILVNDREIPLFHEPDPAELPWKDLGIDVVYECTGRFRTATEAGRHLEAGAKKVIVSSTAKGVKPFIMGFTDDESVLMDRIIAAASCTSNNAAPLAKIMQRLFGIRAMLQNTTHAYTLGEQQLLDNAVGKDPRKARSAPDNIVPATSNATELIKEAMPDADPAGDSTRVPVPNVSRGEYTYLLERSTSVAEINELVARVIDHSLRQAGIYAWTDEPLVSSDFNGRTESGVFDRTLTLLSNGKLAQLRSWYDNESGVSQRMLDMTPLAMRKAQVPIMGHGGLPDGI